MKTKQLFSVAAIVGAIAAMGFAELAQGEYISGVEVSEFSTELGTPGRVAINTVNSKGFDEGTGMLEAGDNCGWMTQGTDYSPFVTYNLKTAYNLASMRIWNWNQANTGSGAADNFTKQGFKTIEILVAGADQTFTSLGTATLDKATATDSYTGQLFSVSALYPAATYLPNIQYVKLKAYDSWYTYEDGGFKDRSNVNGENKNWMNESGLGKVRFTEAATPEPTTLVLLVTGSLGLLAYAWRRRK